MSLNRQIISISVLTLSSTCFILGLIVIIIPEWAHFRSRVRDEKGKFGPWTVCRDMGYGRTLCGQFISTFKPSFTTYAGGICATLGLVSLFIISVFSILQLISYCKRSQVLLSYFLTVFIKLILSAAAALMTLVSVCLFSTQQDDLEKGFIVEFSICFYLQIILTVFSFILFLLIIPEFSLARRLPPDGPYGPKIKKTKKRSMEGTTVRNPGFRPSSQSNGAISVTDSSVQFSTIPPLSRLELARQLSAPRPNSIRFKSSAPYASSSMSSKRASSRNSILSNTNSISNSGLVTPSNTNSLSNSNTLSNTNSLSNSNTLSNSRSLSRDKIVSNSNIVSSSGLVNSISRNSKFSKSYNNGGLHFSSSPLSNGSSIISDLSSVSTISTVASVSSNPRGYPLRSSLKKTKASTPSDDGYGIHNPGFSGTSPTLSRTGSLKKVRIQTQSTDV